MRSIAAIAMLCLSAAAQAEALCGVGEASSGGLKARVMVSPEDGAPRVTYFHVQASNPDGTYQLSVHYDPTDAGLGTPMMASVEAYMPVPDPERAEPEQIEWRAGPGPWFHPGYWGTPQRTGVDPTSTKGSVHYTLAQGRVHPYRTELLERFGPGVRWEFRRLDESGREIGSGAVDYPSSKAIAALYGETRAEAFAKLRPCGGHGPPKVVPPARPASPAPPVPEDRAAFEAPACAILRREAGKAAQLEPQSGGMKLVELSVDCDRRSVRHVFEMDRFGKDDRRDFHPHFQSLSDMMWCSSPYHRRLIGRGWTFRSELREAGDPDGIAVTTRECPG
jgi:hypothetical protein